MENITILSAHQWAQAVLHAAEIFSDAVYIDELPIADGEFTCTFPAIVFTSTKTRGDQSCKGCQRWNAVLQAEVFIDDKENSDPGLLHACETVITEILHNGSQVGHVVPEIFTFEASRTDGLDELDDMERLIITYSLQYRTA